MTYRTLAGWQKALLTFVWLAAIGAALWMLLVLSARLSTLMLVALLLVAFVVAFILSLRIMLNPRGAVRDVSAEQLALASQNDAFSVVSGTVRTPSGELHGVSVVVPTVFGPDSSLLQDVFSSGMTTPTSTGQHFAREETLDFALQAAREQYANAVWVGEPVMRDANEQERAQALRDGVNAKFVLRSGEGGNLL